MIWYISDSTFIGKTIDIDALAANIDVPEFLTLIRRFLYDQLHPDAPLTSSDVPLESCPIPSGRISVFNSATATYYAPSDPCGKNGMHREHIRTTESWQRGPPRHDCVFINSNPELEGMRGLDVGRAHLFFSFNFHGQQYPCALVHWFAKVGDEPDEDTGMWIVEPENDENGAPLFAVLHLDTIFRAAHLIGVYGDQKVPRKLTFDQSLDAFNLYYVNKFIDHHGFEIAF